MRLLNTSTLLLEEFMTKPPPYAILSHTWGDEEVLFKDVENGTASAKKGYEKVKACCKLAASEGYKYCWIDTCCIDKSSSAELSEAINSMFAYYRESQICYVYLEMDVDGHYIITKDLTAEDLSRARWTKRGWTLQELIAPNHLSIYNSHWQFCGTRKALARQLHEATEVDLEILWERTGLFYPNLSRFSIATRMSWASKRETTRPEDIAYCLFGIFGVHLPPLYGEGAEKAFIRLQEEIIRISMDLSFLAWDVKLSVHLSLETLGFLSRRATLSGIAKRPKYFSSSNIVIDRKIPIEPFDITNKGLRVHLPLVELPGTNDHLMVLPNCRFRKDSAGPVGVRVSGLGPDDGRIFYRVLLNQGKGLHTVSFGELQRVRTETFYIAV